MGPVFGKFMKGFSRFTTLETRIKRVEGLVQEVFTISLILYLALFLIDLIWENTISGHLNLHYLLGIVILLGLIGIWRCTGQHKENCYDRKKHVVPIVFFAVMGACIIWYKIRDIGWFSLIVAIVSGILIGLTSLLLLRESDEGSDHRRS